MDKTFITIEEQIAQVLADVSREVVKLVNFITATKRTDKKEFNGKRYVKIEADSNTEWNCRP